MNDWFVPGIVVERYVEIDDGGYAGPRKEWRKHLETRGVIDALAGLEDTEGQRVKANSTHMLFCPVIDITEQDRVKYRGRTYNVTFVDDPMNLGEFLQVEMEVV